MTIESVEFYLNQHNIQSNKDNAIEVNKSWNEKTHESYEVYPQLSAVANARKLLDHYLNGVARYKYGSHKRVATELLELCERTEDNYRDDKKKQYTDDNKREYLEKHDYFKLLLVGEPQQAIKLKIKKCLAEYSEHFEKLNTLVPPIFDVLNKNHNDMNDEAIAQLIEEDLSEPALNADEENVDLLGEQGSSENAVELSSIPSIASNPEAEFASGVGFTEQNDTEEASPQSNDNEVRDDYLLFPDWSERRAFKNSLTQLQNSLAAKEAELEPASMSSRGLNNLTRYIQTKLGQFQDEIEVIKEQAYYYGQYSQSLKTEIQKYLKNKDIKKSGWRWWRKPALHAISVNLISLLESEGTNLPELNELFDDVQKLPQEHFFDEGLKKEMKRIRTESAVRDLMRTFTDNLDRNMTALEGEVDTRLKGYENRLERVNEAHLKGLARLNENSEDLMQEKSSLQEELKQQMKTVREKQKIVDTLLYELAQKQEKMKEAPQTSKLLQETVEQFNTDRRKLEGEIEQLQTQISELEKSLEKANNEATTYARLKDAVKKDNVKLTVELDEMRKTKAWYAEELEKTKKTLKAHEAVQAEALSVDENNSALKDNLAAIQVNLKEKTKTLQRVEAELATLQDEHDLLSNEKNVSAEKNTILMQMKKDLATKLKQLQKLLKTLRTMLGKLTKTSNKKKKKDGIETKEEGQLTAIDTNVEVMSELLKNVDAQILQVDHPALDNPEEQAKTGEESGTQKKGFFSRFRRGSSTKKEKADNISIDAGSQKAADGNVSIDEIEKKKQLDIRRPSPEPAPEATTIRVVDTTSAASSETGTTEPHSQKLSQAELVAKLGVHAVGVATDPSNDEDERNTVIADGSDSDSDNDDVIAKKVEMKT